MNCGIFYYLRSRVHGQQTDMSKTILIFALLFIIHFPSLMGQDQRLADSLAAVYNNDEIPDSARLELLRELSFNEMRDLDLALKYAEELIGVSASTGNDLYLYRGYLQKGNKLRLKGELDLALAAYLKGVEAAGKAKFLAGEGSCYGAIADVYSNSGQHDNAMHYYGLAITTLEKAPDKVALATAITNAGDELARVRSYDSAIVYFSRSGRLFQEVNNETGKVYVLGNLGMIYAALGRNDLAEKNLNEAIRSLEKTGNYDGISEYLLSMSDVYLEKGDTSSALRYATRSLEMANNHSLRERVSQANVKLSQIYEAKGRPGLALQHFKAHIANRDSLNDIKITQNMERLRYDFALAQKQAEVDIANQQQENQRIVFLASVGVIILLLILALQLYRRYLYVRKTTRIIEEEKKRSESLLLNILPEGTARELKREGRVKAQRFESVSVMFTDFISFTEYATHLPPEKLVESVDKYFSRFDDIIDKYGLEKIKTVGDSYMCAGGLTTPMTDHAHRMVRAAIEIADCVKDLKANGEDPRFEIRIGINTGPVVAGVVGTRKFAYDIWGDTVNIASRMESTSAPGKINVSEYTYELIRDEFECEFRGEIAVKNRGMMKMFFVKDNVARTQFAGHAIERPSLPAQSE